MKQFVASAIVLKRTNYGEADRIIQVITPSRGKISLMAKGVRKVNSKLAGSIELFSIIDVTYLIGRGNIERLLSARLKTHFSNITLDLERTNTGYEFIRLINKITEDEVEEEWFNLLADSLKYLNETKIDLNLIKIWFYLSIFRLTGHSPNLSADNMNENFKEGSFYDFDLANMSFGENKNGPFNAYHIKILKLASQFTPIKMNNIANIKKLCLELYPLIRSISRITLDE
jgi:DNA repair protein RecO (recombination protein O)